MTRTRDPKGQFKPKPEGTCRRGKGAVSIKVSGVEGKAIKANAEKAGKSAADFVVDRCGGEG